MARKSFFFADFNPAVWRPAVQAGRVLSEVASGRPVGALNGLPTIDTPVAVAESSPEGVDREELKTVFQILPATAHDAFETFSVRHDEVRNIRAYAEGTDDNPDPDDVTDRRYVQPKDFHLHEFRDNPGQVYVTAQELVVRKIFRRARETYDDQGIALNLRMIDLGELEAALGNAEIIGYKLIDVQSNTPISTYDVLGDDIRNNTEIQGAKGRAGGMRGVAIRLQHGDDIISLWVYRNNVVTFLDYPGDHPGLGLLDAINSIIDNCSELELATVR